MMREEGVVVGLDGDKARVRIRRSDACGKCRICVPLGDGSMVIGAKNAICAGVGDRVSVEIDDSRRLSASFMVFILPLVGLLLGCLVGLALSGSEKIGFLLGAGMFILVFMALRWYDRKTGTRDRSWPRIVGRLGRE
jgi:sigma-E factor negative regulatory protein RseC